VTVNSATSITATSPATITTGIADVKVTTSGGTSATVAGDRFTYTATTPTVTSIAPTSGPTTGGTVVTITGTGFSTGGTAAVGGTAATGVTLNGPTSITATSPATITPGITDVRVTTSGGTSAVVAGDKFTYTTVTPTVTSIAPTSGPSGGG